MGIIPLTIALLLVIGAVTATVCVDAVPAGPSVLALDFGNEWLKGCLANQKSSSIGMHLDVVINEQSSRKTPNLLGFDGDDDRIVGDAALPLVFRSPGRVFPQIKRLIGKTTMDSAAKQYARDYPALQMETTPGRPTIQFKSPKSNAAAMSVEEITVMLLQLARRQADNHVQANAEPEDQRPVTQTVLMVPEHWTEGQRKLISQLSQLAGFDAPNAIVGELTAAAIDYAVRNLPSAGTTRMAFLGAGTMGVSASLVEMERIGSGAEGEIRIRVLKSASDDSIGGYSYDIVVRDALASKFDAQHQKAGGASITSNPRAMAKLLREARDLKEMLSASPLIETAIEELFGGKDFKFSATQEELVSWATNAGLVEKFLAPLRTVLEGASEVAGIEILGGAVRIPSIQTAIRDAFPNVPLGKHVDGDEGALLGAAHYAGSQAGIPKLIRVTVDESAVLPTGSTSDSSLSLTSDQESALRSRIADLDSKAEARRAADAARNALESLLNEARELVSNAPNSKRDLSASLDSMVEKASAFLDDSDKSTTADQFNQHFSDVNSAAQRLRAPKKVEKPEAPSAPRKKRDRRAEHKKAMEEAERQAKKEKPKTLETPTSKAEKPSSKQSKTATKESKGKKTSKDEL